MIFRQNKNWLKYRVKYLIRRKHKELFEPLFTDVFNRFFSFISSKDQWWVIMFFVIFVFVVSSFVDGPEILCFINFQDETSRILVDQRTTNIATIISITLVVVGFLINNLAVKSPLTYKLLFKKSYLYPTIYLTLSTIGCFICVSTLRDSRILYFDFSKTVLAGTYLVFIILFLIGFLFRTIIQFASAKEISNMLHQEFMYETKKNLKSILYKKYSSQEIDSSLQKAGAKPYGFAEALSFTDVNIDVKEVSAEEMGKGALKSLVIKDIQINRITSLILRMKKKNVEVIYYRKLGLDMITEETNDFVWEKGKLNSRWTKLILSSCLSVKRMAEKNEEEDSYRRYFDGELIELSKGSKYRELDTLLQSYVEIYKLQMQIQK